MAKSTPPALGQIMVGRVVSTKQLKTATVLVEGRKTHPMYGKSYKVSKKYQVHDELKVSDGDLVRLVKIRPVSKTKHWKIIEVVGKDLEAIVSEKLKADAASAIAEVLPEEIKENIQPVALVKEKKVTS